jgi:hypothetical protein
MKRANISFQDNVDNHDTKQGSLHTRTEPSGCCVFAFAAGLLLSDQAHVGRPQARIHHIVGYISPQFNSAVALTGEVPLEHITAVNEPEIRLGALFADVPVQLRQCLSSFILS